MTANPNVVARRRGGLRDHYLWVLAAVLGAATIHATASAVHDTSQRRQAAGLVAQAVAEGVTTVAAGELEAAAMELFAPALSVGGTGRGEGPVAIVREHRLARECRCRALLPIIAAFEVAADGAIEVAMADDSTAALGPEVRAALVQLARAHMTASPTPIPSRVRLRVIPGRDRDAAITTVQRDVRGAPRGTIGVLVGADSATRLAFATARAGIARTGHPVTPLARLDSQSLEVRTPNGRVLFGQVDSARRLRATMLPAGTLEGLAVTVALWSDQVAAPLIAPVASNQLWHLGVFLLATILALVIAVLSSRRQTLVARARSDFIAGVSHELRMPLAQILLASETLALEREGGIGERRSLNNSILREARRLVTLVENVLLFSRTGAVGLQPRIEAVPVDALLVDVVEAVHLAVQDAGQAIDLPPSSDIAVAGDRALLRQALVNLVDNAMKYGGRGQRIGLAVEQPSAQRVRIIVGDAGRGVPHADRVRVFEAYERLERDQASERTGTGLGLAVVRQIVAACGGRVWLEAAPAGGTRAIVELPTASVPAPGAQPVMA